MKRVTFSPILLIAVVLSLLSPFTTSTLKAQLAKHLAEGAPGKVYAACTDSQDLYVLYHVADTMADTFGIARWNGTFWCSYPKFRINAVYGKFCMAYYNGQVFVGGYFDKVIGIAGTRNIFRWTGAAYSGVGGGFTYDKSNFSGINVMKVYKGNLYAGGAFVGITNDSTENLGYWNGSKWNKLGNLYPGIKGSAVNDLVLSDVSLYVLGYFSQADTVFKSPNILRWDGSAFSGLKADKNIKGYLTGTSYNGRLTVQALDTTSGKNTYPVKQYNAGIWAVITGNYGKRIGNLVSYNSKLWASGSLPSVLVGGKWQSFNSTGLHNALFYTSLTNNALYLAGDFNSIKCTYNLTAKGAVQIMDGYTEVTGKIYWDSNRNCKLDTGEIPLSGRYLVAKDSSGSSYISTDINGTYDVFLKPDTNDVIQRFPIRYFHNLCTLDSETFKGVMNSTYFYDFPMSPSSNALDLRVSLHADGHARLGDTAYYTLHYENIGITTIGKGVLVLTYDHRDNNFSSTDSPSISGNNATYPFSNLAPGEARNIKFSLSTPSSLSTADTLIFTVRGDSLVRGLDSNLVNNFDTLYQHPVKSFDPNGKTVSPEGLISKYTTRLSYNIFFQNTGKASAYKVIVIDTVDANLPLTKIRLGSASHKYTFSVSNNVLIWTFNNINLPDSTSDAKNSHGDLCYTAYIEQGLAIGTEIKNKAYIYFDYNKPVITNETMDKISIITAVHMPVYIDKFLKVYPNPANDVLIIENAGNKPEKLSLCNVMGQKLEAMQLNLLQSYYLNTSKYPAGIYILRSEDGKAIKFSIGH